MNKCIFTNTKAFTLLESLVGLILVSLICFINVTLINIALSYSTVDESNIYYIANLINNECIIYDDLFISSKELTIDVNDNLIKYSYNDHEIVRTVNNKGYVYIADSQNLKFYVQGDQAIVTDGRYDAYIC